MIFHESWQVVPWCQVSLQLNWNGLKFKTQIEQISLISVFDFASTFVDVLAKLQN